MLQHPCRAAMVLAAFLLYAGSATAQSSERPHAIEDGSWAVLYQVEDILDIDYLNGMLALKYHLADRHALRLGVGANASTHNDGEQLDGGVSGQAQYFLYPMPEREVKFYIGAGPHVGYSTNRIDHPELGKVRDDRWTFGLAGALGTEWFATKHISIFAEYGNHFGIQTTDREITPPTGKGTDYFYRTSARLGVGAYF